MTQYRKILRAARAGAMAHDEGFQATNVGLFNLGEEIDPFIQLDHFRMARPVFGAHPHAGFSAVTYMFEDSENSFVNRDSLGNREMIRPGDTHWSQAGSGLVHEEVPETNGVFAHGIQMFVNLSAADKFTAPRALHLNAADTPVFNDETGARVRVVVGSAFGKHSPLEPLTKVTFLDVIVPANTKFEHQVEVGDSAFVLVIKGAARFDESEETISANEAAVFEREAGDAVLVKTSEDSVQYVFGAGKPFNEPIFSQGPFIMNNREQMQKVIARFRAGAFGTIRE